MVAALIVTFFGFWIAVLLCCLWLVSSCRMCRNRIATLKVDEIPMCDECAHAFLHDSWVQWK